MFWTIIIILINNAIIGLWLFIIWERITFLKHKVDTYIEREDNA